MKQSSASIFYVLPSSGYNKEKCADIFDRVRQEKVEMCHNKLDP
jgi:hypothetical protein